jgi:hypothetical protein
MQPHVYDIPLSELSEEDETRLQQLAAIDFIEEEDYADDKSLNDRMTWFYECISPGGKWARYHVIAYGRSYFTCSPYPDKLFSDGWNEDDDEDIVIRTWISDATYKGDWKNKSFPSHLTPAPRSAVKKRYTVCYHEM